MELTYTNVTFFGKLLRELRGDKEYDAHQHTSFNVDAFVLSPHGRLLLTDDFLDGVIDKHRDHFGKWIGIKSPTLGCPAAYSSGIKDLWNWNIELAQNIWQRPATDQHDSRHLYLA
jgi:hypothetical protein